MESIRISVVKWCLLQAIQWTPIQAISRALAKKSMRERVAAIVPRQELQLFLLTYDSPNFPHLTSLGKRSLGHKGCEYQLAFRS
mmetsp:Transcript_39709/g.58945  ORF Transcript_39709/g.58945 Transcript_39709/m.58945 type:complete len:84 (-) Transcript_39709:172-423(-)